MYSIDKYADIFQSNDVSMYSIAQSINPDDMIDESVNNFSKTNQDKNLVRDVTMNSIVLTKLDGNFI